ncbi:MAG: hypothetical protein HY518_05540, partial [Candidatus Aenigmarchaeota archaeon]|nr:hypothetical protein [Candidatus Aenigmarchaeota archaeon]
MENITIQGIIKRAKYLHSRGKKWHFHMLTPDCIFNRINDKHAFILENRSGNETYVACSDKRYMKEGQGLVKMLYGNKILGKSNKIQSSRNRKIEGIVKKIKEMNKKNIQWHHHMLFPDCIFNKHKGKWNIVFEDA